LPGTNYHLQTTPAGRSGLKNIAKIGQPIPAGWQEGKDFIKGQKLAAGDLVVIQRSDGSLKFGEVTGTAGMPWQNAYEVCVTVDATGNPGASRAEESSKIGKIVAAAVSAAPTRQGSTAPAAAPQTRQGSGGFFGFPSMPAPQPSANANANANTKPNAAVDERKRQQDEAAAKRQAEALERQRQAEEKQRAQQAAMEEKQRQMAEAAAKRQAEMDEKKRQQEEAIRARQQAQMQEQVQCSCSDTFSVSTFSLNQFIGNAICMFIST
jgi:hypothetical protein